MPLDAVFLDIPYMSKYLDFTVDTRAFPDIPALTRQLHSDKQKLIPILDAAISADDLLNKYYQLGNSQGIFIKSGIH